MGIIIRIVFIALGFCIAFMIVFTVLAIKLFKSNNLGNGESVKNNAYNFAIIKTNDFSLSEKVYNPVILKHMGKDANGGSGAYTKSSKAMSLEDEIDRMDLSNISWHK